MTKVAAGHENKFRNENDWKYNFSPSYVVHIQHKEYTRKMTKQISLTHTYTHAHTHTHARTRAHTHTHTHSNTHTHTTHTVSYTHLRAHET